MSWDRGVVVALAGRRPDPPDAGYRRFPLERAGSVLDRLRERLSAPGVRGLVSSAAAGADLLALEVAWELGLRRRIVLPFERERFRETSVADRPGSWAELYDRIVEEASASGDLVVLEDGGGDEAYRRVNQVILDEAEALAGPDGEVGAVIVWEGGPREGDDLTAAFAESAEGRGIPVHEILTIS